MVMIVSGIYIFIVFIYYGNNCNQTTYAEEVIMTCSCSSSQSSHFHDLEPKKISPIFFFENHHVN